MYRTLEKRGRSFATFKRDTISSYFHAIYIKWVTRGSKTDNLYTGLRRIRADVSFEEDRRNRSHMARAYEKLVLFKKKRESAFGFSFPFPIVNPLGFTKAG
jgi:hypothetical protein